MPGMGIDPTLAWLLRLGLGLLFFSAATHKLLEPGAFASALGRYGVLPHRLVLPVAFALPLAEGSLALGLVVPGLLGIGSSFTRLAALGAVALLMLYTVAIGVNLARGRTELECGCGRPGTHRTIGGGLLARNAVLLLASSLCVLPVGDRALGWLDGWVAVAGATSAALLYAALETAAANAAQQRRLVPLRVAPAAVGERV